MFKNNSITRIVLLSITLFFSCFSLAETLFLQEAEPNDQDIYQQQVDNDAILNIKKFGAIGDGKADDTAAIQAAIDAATDSSNPIAKILLIPNGTYVISSTLQVHNARYFRFVGAGGSTRFLWKGDTISPAFKIIDTAYSEFSNFTLSVPGQDHNKPGVLLKTGILMEGTQDGTYESTHNVFRNLWITSILDDIEDGVIIGTKDSFDSRNDHHMFINSTISNYSGAAIKIESKKANNLFFYNVSTLLAGYPVPFPQPQPHGIISEGGSYYWLNGGINGLEVGYNYAFNIKNPTGPININLSNEEGSVGFVKAISTNDEKMDLTFENNRFSAGSKPTGKNMPYVDIQGKADVRINKNFFGSTFGSKLVTFHRSNSDNDDLYEYQYNRISNRRFDQASAIEKIFLGSQPKQLHQNHHYVDYVDARKAAGQYETLHAYPPSGGDYETLEPYFERLRQLSDSQFLFNRYENSTHIINIKKSPYFAKGDGIHDETAIFENALFDLMAACNNEHDNDAVRRTKPCGEGMLLIPEGDYLVERTLNLTAPPFGGHGFRMIGEGSDRSRIIWTGKITTEDKPTVGINMVGISQGEIKGISWNMAEDSSADIGIHIMSAQPSLPLSAKNSLYDVVINGEAGDLATGIKVGAGNRVEALEQERTIIWGTQDRWKNADGRDANNDFHLFQKVSVSGYQNYGFDIVDTQTFNQLFLDSYANGFETESVKQSRIGIGISAPVVSWFGGGGHNHTRADINFVTGGPAVIVSKARFENSARFIINGTSPGDATTFTHMEQIHYTAFNETLPDNDLYFIQYNQPGTHLVENSCFEISAEKKIFYWGVHTPDSDISRSLVGMDFIDNIFVSPLSNFNALLAAQLPTYGNNENNRIGPSCEVDNDIAM